MTEGRRSWICEECDYRVERSATAPSTVAPPSLLAGLPSPVAIPWGEFFVEPHPVLRLHRLCDAIELLVRFLTIISLGEIRCGLDDAPLPDGLLTNLQPNIERPTFGRWWSMLRALMDFLPTPADCAFPELPAFVSGSLRPLVDDGQDESGQHGLIWLRNDIAHGGGISRDTAQRRLDEWMPRVLPLLDGLSFLADAELRFTQGEHAYLLTGPAPSLPVGPGEAGRVSLCRSGEVLDLWPLCDYGPVLPDPSAPRSAPTTSGPRIFYRAERDRLLFATLGVDPWQGESRDTLADFRALFRLDRRQSTAPSGAADFEQEIRADAAALIGRVQEISVAKDIMREAPGSVLWISGPGGLGKSYLMAKLADDYANGKDCCLAWRFRTGDAARCSRLAFLRYAVERLSQWKPLQTETTPPPTVDPIVLREQLAELLNQAAALPAPGPRARPPRVLFFLDGLDEIERLDPAFAHLPFDLVRENVVWVCAGRPERTLPGVFAEDRCRHVFPGGLPPMDEADIRAMLLDETGPFKYALLIQDAEADGQVSNPTVAAIARQADGLPLYVRLVIGDIVSGHFQFRNLAQKLPPSLNVYFDDLIQRLGISDLSGLLPPLLTTITEARAPLDEDALALLLIRRKTLRDGPNARATLRRGLDFLQSMIRPAPAPGGGPGYEPYHLTFREHVHQSPQLTDTNAKTQDEFCALARDWASLPVGHSARRYALQFGPAHLQAARHPDELYALARSEAFLQAQAEALPEDPDAPLHTLRLALDAAISQDDAAKMGEFAITHANHLEAAIRETPLQALHQGSLARAWHLADLYETEKCVLWHLLLAWELRDTKREADRIDTLQRVVAQELPQLTSDWISPLLLFASSPDESAFVSLSGKLSRQVQHSLHDCKVNHSVNICKYLAARGDLVGAMRFVPPLQDLSARKEALQTIVAEQVRSGDLRNAIDTIKTFDRRFADEALESLLEIADVAFKAEDDEIIKEIFGVPGYAHYIINLYKNGWYRHLKSGEVALIREKYRYFTKLEQLAISFFGTDGLPSFTEFQAACEAAKELEVSNDADTASVGVGGRTNALLKIAQAAGKGENIDQTREIFQLAIQSVPASHSNLVRRICFPKIAIAQVEAGLIEDALETEKMILLAINEHCSQVGKPASFVESEFNHVRFRIGRALAETDQFEMALNLAREINRPALLAFTLQRQATSLANAGMSGASREVFAEAVRATRSLPDEEGYYSQSDVLCQIAMAQTQLGAMAEGRLIFEKAFHSRQVVDERAQMNSVLVTVVYLHIRNDDFEAALQLTNTFSEWDRNWSLGVIAKAQIKASMLTAAQETIGLMTTNADKEENWPRNLALQQLAEEYIKTGDLATASIWIAKMSDDDKAQSQQELVEAYVARNEFTLAQDVAAEIQVGVWKEKALATIAKAESGQKDAGIGDTEVILPIQENGALPSATLAEVQSIEDINERMGALWQYSTKAAAENQIQEATTVLSLALALTPLSDECYEFLGILGALDMIRLLLRRFISAGVSEDLLNCIHAAEHHKSSDSELARAHMVAVLLKETAAALARAGHFEEAIKTVMGINNGDRRASGLRDIADAYLALDNKPKAAHTLVLARQAAQCADWKETRVEALFKVAEVQALSGFGADAVETAFSILAEGRKAALTAIEAYGTPFTEIGKILAGVSRNEGIVLTVDAENFKRLLLPCAYAQDTAYEMCSLLTEIYPDQAQNIADMVIGLSQ